MVKSAYETILGKKIYNKLLEIYKKHPEGLYKIYKKGGASIFPAPILNLGNVDRRAIQDRRIISVIDNHPKLTSEEKKKAYVKLKDVNSKRSRNSNYSYDDKWEFNDISRVCEKRIKSLENII